MRIAYDGRQFWGSQRQGSARTVQGELERAAREVTGRQIPIHLAGRTDRGVHASGQVATFSREGIAIPTVKLPKAMNAHLDNDLAVLEAIDEPVGFHARYSAVWREYRYRIWCGKRQPLVDGFVWAYPRPLDRAAMADAAGRLEGEHDFAAFASGGEGVPWSTRKASTYGTVRKILLCQVTSEPNWWGALPSDGELHQLRVVANGFLPKMVRGIVGALVEIGRGSRSVALIDELLASKDRRRSPKNVPANGLTLWAVGYNGDIPTADT